MVLSDCCYWLPYSFHGEGWEIKQNHPWRWLSRFYYTQCSVCTMSYKCNNEIVLEFNDELKVSYNKVRFAILEQNWSFYQTSKKRTSLSLVILKCVTLFSHTSKLVYKKTPLMKTMNKKDLITLCFIYPMIEHLWDTDIRCWACDCEHEGQTLNKSKASTQINFLNL